MNGNGAGVSERNRVTKVPLTVRVPPCSEEAEKGLLGSMLIDRQTLSDCVDRLTIEHFFFPAHQLIFLGLTELYRQQKVIDLITFTQFLADGWRDAGGNFYDNVLAQVGGPGPVTDLFVFVPASVNAAYYLQIVRDKYIARQIIAKCTELIRVAHDEQSEINEVLEQTQATLTEIIIETERPDVLRHVKEGVAEAISQLEHAYGHRGQTAINGLATGIIDFDRMTSGLRGQQLVIVGARPSQGKTALAMNFAANMAVEEKMAVGVFSMEMSYQEIVNRLLCSVSGVSLQRFRDGFLSKKNLAEIPEYGSKISESSLWIDDSPALSISSFKARARLMRTRFGVKAIIVDYLQLMRSPTKRAMDARWLEITEISAALKATAKELEIPVICCAQLNREAEQREFGKPKLSDLRESGSIEQDADIVVLLWRPERHIQHKSERRKIAKLLGLKTESGMELWKEEKDLQPGEITERDEQIDGYASLIVAKQRNGPVGEIRLLFTPTLTRFDSVTKKTWSNREEERQAIE